MPSVHDVAAYILDRKGSMSAMKLQKLVYYSQAWSLVWDEEPLFPQKVQAWANGPVVGELYEAHRGLFKISSVELVTGDPKKLTKEQKKTIDSVLRFYGDKGSQWLSDLTHLERPWMEARKGLAPGDRGNNEITHSAMAEYYGSL